MPSLETRQQKRQRERQQKKKIKDAIEMVNDVVKLRLAPSQVHGIGVFAMRDIKKGEKIYANVIPCMLDIPFDDFNKINKEARQLIIERFPLVAEGSKFMAPDTLMQMYTNHSDNPNYDNKTDKAIRNIKAGEEVFDNYKTIAGWEKIHPWLK